jgi:hypothetical protein
MGKFIDILGIIKKACAGKTAQGREYAFSLVQLELLRKVKIGVERVFTRNQLVLVQSFYMHA